jgi:hypothetical protein
MKSKTMLVTIGIAILLFFVVTNTMTTQKAEAAKKNTQINSHTNINCKGSFEPCTATFGSVTNSPAGHTNINCNER